jgi:hypothetical protein
MILNSDFQNNLNDLIDPHLYSVNKEQARLCFSRVCNVYINITCHDPSVKKFDNESDEKTASSYIMNFVNFIRVNYPNDLILLIDCLFEALNKAIDDPNYKTIRKDEEIVFLLEQLKLREISEKHFNILFKLFDTYNLRIASTLINIAFPASAIDVLLALDERLFTENVQQKITDIILKWTDISYGNEYFIRISLLNQLIQLISPSFYPSIAEKVLGKVGELNSKSLDQKKVCLLIALDRIFNFEQIKNIDSILKNYWNLNTKNPENLKPYFHFMEETLCIDTKPYISVFGKERALQYLLKIADVDNEDLSQELKDEINLVSKNIDDVAILDLTGICRFLAETKLLNQENLKILNEHSSNITEIRILLQDAFYRKKLDQKTFNDIRNKSEAKEISKDAYNNWVNLPAELAGLIGSYFTYGDIFNNDADEKEFLNSPGLTH